MHGIALLVCAAMAQAPLAPETVELSDHFERIVAHCQSWGLLGLDPTPPKATSAANSSASLATSRCAPKPRSVVAFHCVRTETQLDDECRRLFDLLG
jgi:hypothetical protein